MRPFNGVRYSSFRILFLSLIFLAESPAFAATETYENSVDNAKAHADSPDGWVVTDVNKVRDIINVSEAGSVGTNPYGLRYYGAALNNQLIVRTAAESKYYDGESSTATAGTNYVIYRPDLATMKMQSWVTTGNDMTSFIDGQGLIPSTVAKGIERGLGMPDNGTSDTIFEMAVTVGNSGDNIHLLRPVRMPDPTSYSTTTSDYGTSGAIPADAQAAGLCTSEPDAAADNVYDNYKKAYTTKENETYSTKKFPWSQLGYTYYWGQAEDPPKKLSQVQGMSEFILLSGTGDTAAKSPSGTDESGVVITVGIYAIQSYVYTKNNSQYGNGYASFNVTGPCNSLWAGASFQALSSLDAATPNTITVGANGSISGGQGILVGSQNYTVTNYGTIETATGIKKFNVTGSENIALLFKGDTHSSPYIGSVKNILNNYGTITGPGAGVDTAVKALAGNTEITNTGAITGTTAIDCSASAGTVSITNRGVITGGIKLAVATPATLDIGNTALTVTNGTITALTLQANSSSDFGRLTTTGTLLNAATTISVAIEGYVPNNTTFKVMDASGAGIGTVPGTITTTSPVFSMSGSDSTGDLVLTAARANSYSSFAPNANGAAAGAVLNSIAASGTATGDTLTVLSSLDSMTSGQAIGDALESMIPTTDNSIPQTTQVGMNQFVMASVSRLDNFQDPALAEPSSRPESHLDDYVPQTPEVWTQGFGTYMHQDPRANSNGYDATVWGTALGFDLPVRKPLKVGASGGFAQDFVRAKDSSARTDVDSYQGALYGTYGWERAYIDVLAAFACNIYDSSRHVAAGIIDRIASGAYNGQQYTGYIGGGYRLDIKELAVTPIVSFQYMHLRVNSYEETGAGALSLNVSAQDTDVAQTGLGVKFARQLDFTQGSLIPELRVKWLYDWIGDDQQLTSTFTGGGGAFTTNGFTPAQSSYDFGAKLTFITHCNITISANYDFELKEDYYGHYGYAELRYRF